MHSSVFAIVIIMINIAIISNVIWRIDDAICEV